MRVLLLFLLSQLLNGQINSNDYDLFFDGYEVEAQSHTKLSFGYTTQINISLVTSDGNPIEIYWSDGTSQLINSSTSYTTKNFTVSTQGYLLIIDSFRVKEFRSNQGSWNFNIGDLPAGLTYYYNSGINATTGNIGDLPAGLTYYYNRGSNTTTGNIGDLPAGLTYYHNAGNNTTYYNSIAGGKSWANNQVLHLIRAGSLTSAMVDAYLIDLSQVSTWTGDKLIDLRGNSQPRTSASDAAVSTLISKGVSVITN